MHRKMSAQTVNLASRVQKEPVAQVQLKSKSKLYMAFLTVLFASGSYQFGFYLSIFNPLATPLLKNVLHLSDQSDPSISEVQGNIHSFPAITAFLTLLFLLPVMTGRLGRIRTVFAGEIIGLLMICSYLFLDKFSSDRSRVAWLGFVRLLTGVVVSVNTATAQLILKEVMQDGWLEVGSFMTFVFLGGGSFLSFAIGRIYSEEELAQRWKAILCLPSFFSILRILGLYVAYFYQSRGRSFPGVESVKWIMERNWDKHEDSEKNGDLEKRRAGTLREIRRLLGNLYVCDLIQAKLDEIIADYESQNAQKEISLRSILCGEYAKSVVLAVLINVGMKFTGIDFMMFYSTDIFNKISGE